MSLSPKEAQFASELIARKAHFSLPKLARNKSNQDDREQEVWTRLLARLPGFNPSRGTKEAFITVVAESALADIQRRERAQKRGGGASPLQLPAEVAGAEGVDPVIRKERAERVAEVLRGLSTLDRQLCELLTRMSIAEAARLLGVPRRTVRDRQVKLRETFAAAGFDDGASIPPPRPDAFA